MLMLLAHIFGWFVARRNRTYDQGKRPLIRLQVPVISIGNVSAGGSGKTPVTELVVNLLRSIRRNPAVVARGYKRRGSGIVVVHDGVRIRTDWTKAGDEPFMLATALDDPVVVGPHKGDAAVYAAGSIACDVVVVDDGFQHRDLYRDLDIVLVDTATVADQRLLPAGRLREPLTSIGRADVVVLTQPSIDANAVRTHMRADAVLARVSIEKGALTDLATGHTAAMPPRCMLLTGIARPERVLATVQAEGTQVLDHRVFADHHDYTKAEVASVIAAAVRQGVPILTTAKDAVKLHAFVDMAVAASTPIIVVHVHATLDEGAHEFITMITKRIAS
jgi:tetraacyldisaccharide 4'-kinase